MSITAAARARSFRPMLHMLAVLAMVGALIPLQALTSDANTVSGSLGSSFLTQAVTIEGSALRSPSDPDSREDVSASAAEFEFIFAGAAGGSSAAFCIDIFTSTFFGQQGYEDIGWDASQIAKLAEVTYILRNYSPSTAGGPAFDPPGSTLSLNASGDELAAAVQTAIWMFTDGFLFGDDYGKNQDGDFLGTPEGRVRQSAEAIYTFVDTTSPMLPSQPNPAIGLTGPANAAIGGPAGPYTATVTGAATGTQITFDPGVLASASATTTTTTRPVGNDGTVDFYIPEGDVDTTATVTATVTASVGFGTAFAVPNQVRQRIILASDTQASASAEVDVTFTFDGSITVNKQDDSQQPLSGARFELQDVQGNPVGNGDGTFCTTDGTGTCQFTGLQPNVTYRVAEVEAPEGYELSVNPVSGPIELSADVPSGAVSFTNSSFPYRISVDGPATNSVTYAHEFTATLEVGSVGDGGFVWEPVASETLRTSWSGTGSITGSEPCTTDANGQCVVTVDSNDPGTGTLTASWITPYQHASPVAPEDAPPSTLVDAVVDTNIGTIAASTTKTWIGYVVSLEGDFFNVVGDNHVFAVTVKEDSGTSTTNAVGVEVDLVWVGPEGSGFAAEGSDDLALRTSCTTSDDGTCTVEVTAPQDVSRGTLSIAEVSGEPVEGQPLVVKFEGQGPSATKTWVDYEVTLEQPATNLVGNEHEFTIAVNRITPDGNARAEGVQIEVCWSGPDGSGLQGGDSSDCATVTTSLATDGDPGGVALATVASPHVPGAGTLTVTRILSDGDVDLPDAGLALGGGPTTAEKEWISLDIDIGGPATNLVNDPHEFRVTVNLLRQEGSNVTLDGLGLSVNAELLGGSVGTITEPDCDSLSATDTQAICSVTVESDQVGYTVVVADATATLGDETLTVETDPASWDRCRVVVAESEFETQASQDGIGFVPCGPGVKTWVDYEVTGFEEAVNPVGMQHRFLFEVYELRPVFQARPVEVMLPADAQDVPSRTIRVPATGDLSIALERDGTIVSVNDVDVDGEAPVRSAVCELDPDLLYDYDNGLDDDEQADLGTCHVVIESDGIGTSEVTATYTATVDGTERSFTVTNDNGDPAPSIKHWIDIEVAKKALLDEASDGTPTLTASGSGPWPVTYEFTVTNPTDRDLEITSLIDRFFDRDEDTDQLGDDIDLLDALVEVNGESNVLVAGGAVSFTYVYDVSTQDRTRGFADNTVTVEGLDEEFPNPDEPVADHDDESIRILTPPPPPPPGQPGIGVVKVANPTLVELGEGEDATGTVNYTYTVFNTGQVVLANVTLTDDVLGDLTDELRGALGRSTMSIGEQVDITVTQSVGVPDIGTLTNVATTTGTNAGRTVTATDTATVEIVQVLGEVLEPRIEVVKKALVDLDDDALKTVTVGADGTADVVYRYTITNTGDTTLGALTLVDDVIGDLSDELDGVVLEPGESTVVEVTYTTTTAQLDAGSVTNVAVVTGTSPEGAIVGDEDDETVFLVEVLDTSITTPVDRDPDASTGGRMPQTGAAATALAILALGLAALGMALLTVTRRRRLALR